MNPALAIATAILSLAPEGTRRVLIGADLSRQSVVIDRIDGTSIGVVDERGVRRTIAARDVLAIYASDRPRRMTVVGARAVGVVDGQVLVGTLEAITGDSESLLVSHPILGEMRVALDKTLWIAGADAPAIAPTTGDDTVVLANGDLLSGFVVGINDAGEEGPMIEFEASTGATQELALRNVLSVLIANSPERAAGSRLWLADGTSVGVKEISPLSGADAGIMRITPALLAAPAHGRVATESEPSEDRASSTDKLVQTGTLVMEHVVGWMPDAGRVVALAGLRVLSVDPTPPRPWTEGPGFEDVERVALGAPDVLLPGPARIEWELPPGADGLSCEVTLPEAFRDWGDCEVVILAGDGAMTERWRGRVNAGQPSLPVALELADKPRRLIVAVEPGAFGPVQDRPTLVTPLIRIGPLSGP